MVLFSIIKPWFCFTGDNCRYAVSWERVAGTNDLVFETSVETDDEYVALGFSRNDDMVRYIINIVKL